MVELEKRAHDRGVYAAWRERWQEIDRALENLGASDFAAYADLMMNNEVALELRTPAHRAEVVAALDRVTAAMQQQIDAPATERQTKKDLRFEVRGLKTLRESLAPRAEPKRREARPASRKAPRRSPRRR